MDLLLAATLGGCPSSRGFGTAYPVRERFRDDGRVVNAGRVPDEFAAKFSELARRGWAEASKFLAAADEAGCLLVSEVKGAEDRVEGYSDEFAALVLGCVFVGICGMFGLARRICITIGAKHISRG